MRSRSRTKPANRLHFHPKVNGATGEPLERCPVCDQPLPASQAQAIRQRLEAEQEQQVAAAMKGLETRFAAHVKRADADKAAAIERTRREAVGQIEKARREGVAAAAATIETENW